MSSISSNFPLITVENLTPDEVKIVEKRMRPNEWSVSGFLTEHQSLTSVAYSDRKHLEHLSITYEQIADKLDGLINKCDQIFKRGHLPLAEGKFLIQKRQTKGYQTCPFTFSNNEGQNDDDCGNHKGSVDYCITRIDINEQLQFASLMPHLIRDHHFFQGGDYRLNPETAVKFFDLKKEVSYKPQMKTAYYWVCNFRNTLCDIVEEDLQNAKRVCLEHKKIAEGIDAYLIDGATVTETNPAKKIKLPPVMLLQNLDSTNMLLQNLDPTKNYLYLACDKAAKTQPVKMEMGGSILEEDFIMSGSSLYTIQKKEEMLLDLNDDAALVESVVFNKEGKAIRLYQAFLSPF